MEDDNKWEVVRGKRPNRGKAKEIKSEKIDKKEQKEKQKIGITLPKLERERLHDGGHRSKTAAMPTKIKANDVKLHEKKSETIANKKQTVGQKKKDVSQNMLLEAAINKLNIGDYEDVLSNDKVTFENSPSVWLKDLVSMLNNHLKTTVDEGVLFDSKPMGYPVSLLSSDFRDFFVALFHQCDDNALGAFVEYITKIAVIDCQKASSVVGYQIILQLIAEEKPDVVMQTISQHLDLIRSNQNKHRSCLLVLWTMGNVGIHSFTDGLKVWRDIMLPLITTRAYSSYCVSYVEQLFEVHDHNDEVYSVFNNKSFLPIFDLLWSPATHLSENMQKRLIQLYPRIKEFAYGETPREQLRYFFPSYLVRLNNAEKFSHKQELLDCLVECLAVDSYCFSVWKQLYPKNLHASSILMKHILENSKKVDKRFSFKLLKETVKEFQVMNQQLGEKMKRRNGYDQCVYCCDGILSSNLNASWFSCSRVLFTFILLLFAVVAADTYTSKGFKRSQTVQFLKQYGVWKYLEQAWIEATVYLGIAYVWFENNIPHYASRANESFGPYLKLFWQNLYDLGVVVKDYCKPLQDYANQKGPEVLEWIQLKMPWWREQCILAWDITIIYSVWIWQKTIFYCSIAVAWLEKNIFTGQLSPENLQHLLVDLLTMLREYMFVAYNWVQQVYIELLS